MASFIFEVRAGDHVLHTEPVELPSAEAARIDAAKRIGDLLHQRAGQLWADHDWQMDVTDAGGLILFVIQISAMRTAATIRSSRNSETLATAH